MTQTQKVLEYMERFGSITALEALNAFGCMRLASRISDLRHAGFGIAKEMIDVKNREDEVTKVARYFLVSKPSCTSDCYYKKKASFYLGGQNATI